jgi:hypothetical protein
MACSTRGPPSTSSTCALPGSMWRNSPGSVCLAISASVPAISTPVGPAPITTKVSQGAAAFRVGGDLGRLERQQHAAADLEGIGQRLQARGATRAHSSWPK